MKTITKYFYLISLIILCIGSFYPQEVRPVCDDVGFCWQGDQLDVFLKWLDNNCPANEFESENLIANFPAP